jgi:hypothetical protein
VVSFDRSREFFLNKGEEDTLMLEINIRMSDNYYIYSRQVGTIYDLLALVGGYVSIMMIGGELATNFIAKYVYMNALLKDLYFTNIYQDDDFDIGFTKQRRRMTKKYRQLYEKRMKQAEAALALGGGKDSN